MNNMKKISRGFIISLVAILTLSLGVIVWLTQVRTAVQPAVAQATQNRTLATTDVTLKDGQFVESVNESDLIGASDETPDSYYCLRDDLAIFTKNQAGMGLCWNFTANTALETAFGLAYGEFYDFSDAYNAVTMNRFYPGENNGKAYVIGDGGNIAYWSNLIASYGVVLEADMPYEEVFGIKGDNENQVFESVRKYAYDFNTDDGLGYINYYCTEGSEQYLGYNDVASETTRTNTINRLKHNLKRYGAIYSSIHYSTPTNHVVECGDKHYTYSVVYNDVECNINHGVTIIGWDDDFTYGDTQGAWIVLNSYGNSFGNDGIFYVPYSDMTIDNILYSVIIQRGQSIEKADVAIEESNSNYINKYVGKYKYLADETTLTPSVAKQKNLFYSDQDISLKYKYTIQGSADYNIQVSMRGANALASNNFTYAVNKANKEINISSIDNSTDKGAYIITIKFDFDKDGTYDQTILKELFVMDGLEIGSITAYTFNINGNTPNFDYPTYFSFDNFNSCKQEFNISTEQDGVSIIIDLASYGEMTECNIYYQTQLISSNTTAIKSLDNRHAKLYLNFYQYYFDRYPQAVVEIINERATRYYTFNFTNIDSDDNLAYLHYDLGGASLADKDNIVNFGSSITQKHYLPTPTLDDKYFWGWYADSALTQPLAFDATQHAYYLTLADTTQSTDKNYNELLYEKQIVRRNAIVYAKWSDQPPLTLSSNSIEKNIEYGDAVSITLPTINGGSGDFEINLSTTPSWLEFDGTNYVGICDTLGSQTITYSVKDNSTNAVETCTININVAPREITYKINDAHSKYGERLAILTGEIIDGELIDGEPLNIAFATTASENASAGTYSITGENNNQNYAVTFIDGTYTIEKLDMYATARDYVAIYDTNSHTISDNFSVNMQISEPYQATYSLDNVNFSNESPTFKDVTQTTVYVHLESQNYNDYDFSINVKISPYELTIVWDNTTLVYNEQLQFPDYHIANPLGETINFSESGGNILPNLKAYEHYEATLAVLENTNYTIKNPTCVYNIQRATAYADLPEIDLKQVDKAKYLKDITLPQGYSWEDPTLIVGYGYHQFTIIYTPESEYYAPMYLHVGIDKPKPNYAWIYVICAGVLLIALVIALIFVIRSRKRNALLAGNSEYDAEEIKDSRRKKEKIDTMPKSDKKSRKADKYDKTADINANINANSMNASNINADNVNTNNANANATSRPNMDTASTASEVRASTIGFANANTPNAQSTNANAQNGAKFGKLPPKTGAKPMPSMPNINSINANNNFASNANASKPNINHNMGASNMDANNAPSAKAPNINRPNINGANGSASRPNGMPNASGNMNPTKSNLPPKPPKLPK